MAALLSVTDPDPLEEIFAAARKLKRTIYGNRIVLFAPLYIGNKCANACRLLRLSRRQPRGSAAHARR